MSIYGSGIALACVDCTSEQSMWQLGPAVKMSCFILLSCEADGIACCGAVSAEELIAAFS